MYRQSIENQIEKAAKIGAEYFVIDAGWFGTGEGWVNQRGDWSENTSGGFCGKMCDISRKVRECGMRFGLWFEIETASHESYLFRQHRDYLIESNDCFFLDFSNEEACQYIFDMIKMNIEKYNVEYIKFDFNQDTDFDDTHCAYMSYYDGYRKLIQKIRKEYPNIYLENCASGGLRCDLRNSIDFDSFWLSDNQSPYEGMRIFKEGIKRLPPQCIEKWAVLRSIENFSPNYYCGENEKIISTNDAIWDGVVGVHQSFLNGFLSGGPIGISCDLNMMSEKLLEDISAHVTEFKEEREFWENAVCSILADTDNILVLEYCAFNVVKIIVYSYKITQDSIYVYPKIDEDAVYWVQGRQIPGSDIAKNGIKIQLKGNYRAVLLTMERE